jgi:hypothetical protein
MFLDAILQTGESKSSVLWAVVDYVCDTPFFFQGLYFFQNGYGRRIKYFFFGFPWSSFAAGQSICYII